MPMPAPDSSPPRAVGNGLESSIDSFTLRDTTASHVWINDCGCIHFKIRLGIVYRSLNGECGKVIFEIGSVVGLHNFVTIRLILC